MSAIAAIFRWIANIAGMIAFAALAAAAGGVIYVIAADPAETLKATIQSGVTIAAGVGGVAFGVWTLLRVIQGAFGGGRRRGKKQLSSRQAVRYARMGMQRD